MTSTDYVQGINKMKKPTTKVMAPPGGKTNINIFGGEEPQEEHVVNKGQALRNHSSVFASAEEPAVSVPEKSKVLETSQPQSTRKEVPSLNAHTEENPGKERPSTKVMAPPGGKTSINLFG
nr:jupiter microtubule associated homolog 2 [Hydra vulgaris]